MTDKRIPVFLHYIAVLWPSFLVAILANGLFFSAFDPDDLYAFGQRIDLSRFGVYTIGFLLFWSISILASIGTLYFTVVNHARRQSHKLDR